MTHLVRNMTKIYILMDIPKELLRRKECRAKREQRGGEERKTIKKQKKREQ